MSAALKSDVNAPMCSNDTAYKFLLLYAEVHFTCNWIWLFIWIQSKQMYEMRVRRPLMISNVRRTNATSCTRFQVEIRYGTMTSYWSAIHFFLWPRRKSMFARQSVPWNQIRGQTWTIILFFKSVEWLTTQKLSSETAVAFFEHFPVMYPPEVKHISSNVLDELGL